MGGGAVPVSDGQSTAVPSVTDRLGANRFETDPDHPHIEVDQDLCRSTGTGKRIIAVCSAGVYTERDGQIHAEYAACLECGSCLAVASPGALTWHYPLGGYGVQFRQG